MTRDHMMGFIQPNEETHGEGWDAPRWPFGYPEWTAAERKIWRLAREDEDRKDAALRAFERDDHQPDGTVRPAKAEPAGAHMSTWFFGGFRYVHLHGTNAVTVTRIA